jgi:anti-sigma B factor antagonist
MLMQAALDRERWQQYTWRHAALCLRSAGQPLTTSRCSRRRCTIRSSRAGTQHDPSGLRVDVRPQRDSVRVTTAGELDLANSGALQAQLSELRHAGFQHVVLDLRALTFMDSAGVRLIVREDRLARSTGRRFSLIKGVGAAQRLLDLCGLSERLDFDEPTPAPVSAGRSASPRRTRVERPDLGVAFQCYLAELRQQGRAPRRPGTGGHARMITELDVHGER